MSLPLVRVLLGARSSGRLEGEIQNIFSTMPEDDRDTIEVIRDESADLALMVAARVVPFGEDEITTPAATSGEARYFGPRALKFLAGYAAIANGMNDLEPHQPTKQELPRQFEAEGANRLAYTITPRDVHYDQVAATDARRIRPIAHKYLAEERRDVNTDLQHNDTPTRRIIGRDGVAIDGRTRVSTR